MRKQRFVYTVLAGASVVTMLMLLGAGYVSYQHGLDFAREGGETGLSAQIIPALIDGVVLVASGVLLVYRVMADENVPWVVWVFLGSGLLASFFANVVHGVHHHLFGVLTDGWPAYALFGAFELLLLLIQVAHRFAAQEPAVEQEREHIAPVVQNIEPVVPAVEQEVPIVRPVPELVEHIHPQSLETVVVANYEAGVSGRDMERMWTLRGKRMVDRRRIYSIINDHREKQAREAMARRRKMTAV